MRSRETSVFRTLDWWVVLIFLIMIFSGWISVYAASYNYDNIGIFDFASRSGKQLLWMGLAGVIGFFILMIDARSIQTYAPVVYFIMLAVLLVTIFVAPDVKGSRSWLVLGPVSIQPAEFGKFATALMLGYLFNTYNFNFLRPGNFLKASLIILVPFFLIIMQRETGSALIYLTFIVLFYREGMSGIIMMAGLLAIVVFVVGVKYGNIIVASSTDLGMLLGLSIILLVCCGMIYFYSKDRNSSGFTLLAYAVIGVLAVSLNHFVHFNMVYGALLLIVALMIFMLLQYLKTRMYQYLVVAAFAFCFTGFLYSVDYAFDNVLESHQQVRIKVLLGMEDDLKGAGYNVNQAKIAIGSGGINGKGFLNGTQTKLKYVPEQDTDFIFCTIGEEEGFLGSLAVVALFTALILRLIYLAERQRSTFARVYGYCVVSVFMFHFFVNIGMVIGLCPVIGIPLPFFSYGGSSLWSFTILLFIFLRFDASRMETY